jgi:hypothetical protein
MEPKFEWGVQGASDRQTRIYDAATATASAGHEARENALGMQPLSGSARDERATNSGNLPGDNPRSTLRAFELCLARVGLDVEIQRCPPKTCGGVLRGKKFPLPNCGHLLPSTIQKGKNFLPIKPPA